ncbi:hypothetical protein [Actinoplanes sp. NPDC051851]|uniref:hypothetical protein n=1 Tax=Actinoplanes sp. NPDC051851 TaxID=3154753 RepID=UPI00343A25BB
MLALVAAATVAGLKGYTAISGWIDDVPAEILDSLYQRVDARPAGRPSRSTIWRVCTLLCCGYGVDTHILAGQVHLSFIVLDQSNPV